MVTVNGKIQILYGDNWMLSLLTLNMKVYPFTDCRGDIVTSNTQIRAHILPPHPVIYGMNIPSSPCNIRYKYSLLFL